MPELPEVNTLVLALDNRLKGDAIKKWCRLSPELRRPVPGPVEIKDYLGRKIISVKRVAKSIYFVFEKNDCLHIHLGMTGYFSLSEEVKELRHEHLRMELKSGRILSFCDQRKFGVVEITPFPAEKIVEPFKGELSVLYLKRACARSNRSIKALIMDQTIIAGLGNIYAAESLFHAGILPFREACSLSEIEIKKLKKAIIDVIDTAIKSGARSLTPDFKIDSQTTHFDIVTDVYGKENSNCNKCKRAKIMCVRIGGRSSFYCPVCQH